MAKRIAFIVGSTRKGSFNLQLANIAEGMLEGKADVVYIDPAALPFVNQDTEFPAPEPVKNARDVVMSSDAIWIFTPEYNQSIPGVLKNLLDWLSRPLDPSDPERKTAIRGKKVIVSGAGGGKRTQFCREALFNLLAFIGAEELDDRGRGFALDRRTFTENIWEPDESVINDLKEQADILIKSI
jgi:NAD(P)H-dependent FMN reductase